MTSLIYIISYDFIPIKVIEADFNIIDSRNIEIIKSNINKANCKKVIYGS